MQRRPWFTLLAAALVAGGAALAAEPPAFQHPPMATAKPGLRKPPPKPVDINSASRAELKALPGIGDAEADRIIAARPYLSKAKLHVDKVLPEQTYNALKGRIVALQKAQPPRKAQASAAVKPPAKP